MVSPNVFSESRAMTHGYDGNKDQSPLHPFIKALSVPDAGVLNNLGDSIGMPRDCEGVALIVSIQE